MKDDANALRALRLSFDRTPTPLTEALKMSGLRTLVCALYADLSVIVDVLLPTP